MRQFENIFETAAVDDKFDFDKLVKDRREILKARGFDVNNVNWDLYAKILKAKYHKLKTSQK